MTFLFFILILFLVYIIMHIYIYNAIELMYHHFYEAIHFYLNFLHSCLM